MTDVPTLTGLRVLVVEDEALIGMVLTAMLEDLGCSAVQLASEFTDALTAASSRALDVAIVDLNLNGQSALPVAVRLAGRGIPIVFSSGYGELPPGLAGPVLRKPYDAAALEHALRQALGERP